MKKTDFLRNGPSYILPKIKYVISEPHGDLLHWNLSRSLTFDFLVHQEGGDGHKLLKITTTFLHFSDQKCKFLKILQSNLIFFCSQSS